jgi:hypothetical protein
MEWIETPQSSNVDRFGYDGSMLVLRVQFKNSSVYDYYEVPQGVFDAMKNAPSVGQFLAQQVKGIYRYARI